MSQFISRPPSVLQLLVYTILKMLRTPQRSFHIQGWTNFPLRARKIGRAILCVLPIRHAKKWVRKIKVIVHV